MAMRTETVYFIGVVYAVDRYLNYLEEFVLLESVQKVVDF